MKAARTGAAATTTTLATGTTAAVVGEFEPYVASGDQIPVADLTLAVDAVGPIALGSPAAESIGRLIASLGDADPQAEGEKEAQGEGSHARSPGSRGSVRWLRRKDGV